MNKFGWATAIALLLGIVLGLMFSGRNGVTAAPNVVNSFNTRTGNVTLTSSDVTSALTFTPANQADLTATNTNLADNYFTKAASDSRFALLGSSYTKTESDARYAASGQIVTGLNNLTGGVTLNAGPNITITPSGNTLTIGASTSSSQPFINPLRVATLQWYNENRTGAGISFGQQAVGFVFDGSNMWTTTGFSLIKLRPGDGAILGTFSTQTGGAAGPLTFDGTNIWVGITDNPLLLKFRASDGAFVSTFSLPAITQQLAFDGQHVWATSGTKLVKLRPSDGAIVDQVELGSPVQGLAVDNQAWMWATLLNGTVVRVHVADSEIAGPYNVGADPKGIAFDGANMWVANAGNLFVTKLRASDGAFLGSFIGTINVGNPLQVAFDGTHMWVTTTGGHVKKFRVSDGTSVGSSFFGITNLRGIAFDGANIWVAHSSGVSKL